MRYLGEPLHATVWPQHFICGNIRYFWREVIVAFDRLQGLIEGVGANAASRFS